MTEIDVTATSANLAPLISEWNADFYTGSDHALISYQLDGADPVEMIWDNASTKWDEFRDLLKSKCKAFDPKGKWDAFRVENATISFAADLVTAWESSTKQRKATGIKKLSYWDDELYASRDEGYALSQLFKETLNPEYHELLMISRSNHRRLIKEKSQAARIDELEKMVKPRELAQLVKPRCTDKQVALLKDPNGGFLTIN